MLSNLATTPSALAGSGAPLAPMAVSTAPSAVSLVTCGRPAFVPAVPAAYATGATRTTAATRGRFQAGMALSNHNIKVWPLGPQDGSTG